MTPSEQPDYWRSLDESLDALEGFKPQVSLATLKADGIAIDGDEAIAIGAAMCRFYTASRSPAAATAASPLDMASVFIDAGGGISAGSDEPRNVRELVQSIGKLVSDVLPADAHLFFRTKVLSKAVMSPGQFSTLKDLADELAVYERPDGKGIIRGLYSRWETRTKTEPASPAFAPAPAPAPMPLPKPPDLPDLPAPIVVAATTPPPPAAVRRRYDPGAIALLVTGAVAILGVSGWILVNRWRPAETPPPPSVTVEVTTAPLEEPPPVETPAPLPVPPPTPTPAPSVSPIVTPVATAKPTPPPAQARAGIPTPRPQVRVALPARAAAPAAPPATVTAELAPPVATVAPAATPSAPVREIVVPQPEAPVAAAPTAAVAARKPVYSRTDADVTPPTPVLPRLLSSLRPSSPRVRLDALTIEVLVNADGTVESVKGLVAPQNMGEAVLLTNALSVVKSWAFKPATKDGTPVRYRHTVPLRDLTGATPTP